MCPEILIFIIVSQFFFVFPLVIIKNNNAKNRNKKIKIIFKNMTHKFCKIHPMISDCNQQ